MALPQPSFGTQTGPFQSGQLDQNFAAVGALITIPCVVAGTNTLTLTALANCPTILAYANYLRVSGIAANSNSGATTANVFGLGALNVYKDSGSGPVALTGGEIVAGNQFSLVYDLALNTGAGGFHLLTTPATSIGTVTSVATGSGLTGGTITGAGTIAFSTISSHTLLANVTGGAAVPSSNTLSAVLDLLGTTQGGIPVRGSSVWAQNVETSWSPTIAFGGASVGITYSTQVGQYLAIGYLVFAMFNVVLTSKGSSTGSATLSLPVAAGASRVGGGMITNYSVDTGVTDAPFLRIAASASTASILKPGAGVVTALSDTAFTGSDVLSGFMWYLTG